MLKLHDFCNRARWIARDLGLSKNTVAAIVGRSRADMDHKVEVAA